MFSLLADLVSELPAAVRMQRLVTSLRAHFHCGAMAVLQLEGGSFGGVRGSAQLARESRGFFDKSFRLGESDLPTRLRIEAEAADAERQAVRARIELAAAISAWRQALGLLPQ